MAVWAEDSQVLKTIVQLVAVNVVKLKCQWLVAPLGIKAASGTLIHEQLTLKEVLFQGMVVRGYFTWLVEPKGLLQRCSVEPTKPLPEFPRMAFCADGMSLSAGLKSLGLAAISTVARFADLARGVSLAATLSSKGSHVFIISRNLT